MFAVCFGRRFSVIYKQCEAVVRLNERKVSGDRVTLQESGEMYLETIYILQQSNKAVRSIDICSEMGFSKPSVSRAVNKLKNEDYIEIDEKGLITLTKTGLSIAKKIYEKHTVITKMLISLGIDKKTAAMDACRIEHVVSDKTFRAIKKYLKNMEEE